MTPDPSIVQNGLRKEKSGNCDGHGICILTRSQVDFAPRWAGQPLSTSRDRILVLVEWEFISPLKESLVSYIIIIFLNE